MSSALVGTCFILVWCLRNKQLSSQVLFTQGRWLCTRRIFNTPTIAEVAPLPARGEGWGEGLVPSNCRTLLKSPLPDPHFSVVGRGNRLRAWWWYQDAPLCTSVIEANSPQVKEGLLEFEKNNLSR